MQRPQSVTWTTHTEESTTLLDYKTTGSPTLDVQHCNRILLVQYSIYIFNKE